MKRMASPALVVAVFSFVLVSIEHGRADEEISKEQIKKAAELAKASAGNDDKKFVETFSTTDQLSQSPDGRKQDDVLTAKRKAEILSADKPVDSVYANPRFYNLYASLIRESVDGRRIWGGKKAKAGEFDACVAIGSDTEYFCSGTLIASRMVCTAGHCFEDGPSKICIGQTTSEGGREYMIRKTGGLIRHPNFHLENSPHNDLTLLILEKDVENVTPVKIADTYTCETMTTVRIVGFGNTDRAGRLGYGTKKVADVVVVSPDGVRFNKNYGADPGLEFVAEDRHADTCTGDSGGPAFVQGRNSDWLLAGATSRATDMAKHECGDGGIYVRMDKQLPWIQKVALQNGISLPQ